VKMGPKRYRQLKTGRFSFGQAVAIAEPWRSARSALPGVLAKLAAQRRSEVTCAGARRLQLHLHRRMHGAEQCTPARPPGLNDVAMGGRVRVVVKAEGMHEAARHRGATRKDGRRCSDYSWVTRSVPAEEARNIIEQCCKTAEEVPNILEQSRMPARDVLNIHELGADVAQGMFRTSRAGVECRPGMFEKVSRPKESTGDADFTGHY
jgi:hypothetical protein